MYSDEYRTYFNTCTKNPHDGKSFFSGYDSGCRNFRSPDIYFILAIRNQQDKTK